LDREASDDRGWEAEERCDVEGCASGKFKLK
jgi:hypothetical protein